MKNSDISRILSPLVFFLFHIIYLVFWSHDPFLKKWIDGSFTFFVALVLCNVIRAHVVAKAARNEQPDDPDQERDGSETGTTP